MVKSMQNISFECAYSDFDSRSAVCADSGFEVTHQCSGVAERAVYSCPGQVEGSACRSLSGPAGACRAVSFSPTNTTCVCRTSGGSQRKLASELESVGFTVDVTAVMDLSFLEFTTVMQSSTEFNSVQALEDTYLVSLAFVVLWMSMIGIVLIANATSTRGAVSPARLKIPAEGVATSIDTSVVTAESTLSSLAEEEIKLYVSAFFPEVFEDKPRRERSRYI